MSPDTDSAWRDEFLRRLDHQDSMFDKIFEQVRETNGRVTRLEKEKIAEDARVDERARVLEEMARQRAAELKAQGEAQNRRVSRNQWVISTGVVIGIAIFTALIGVVASHA